MVSHFDTILGSYQYPVMLSVEDLHVLNTRELQRYTISQEDIDTYCLLYTSLHQADCNIR